MTVPPVRPRRATSRLAFAFLSALLVAIAVVEPPAAEAQSRAGGASCFQAGPLPDCRSWWVTESFVGMRFREQTMGTAGVPGDGGGWEIPPTVREVLDGSFAYSATVGWMRNTGSRSAVGGVIQVSDIGVRIGPRLRRWLGSSYAVDVELGPRWQPGRIEVVEVEASISRWDLVGFTVATAHDFGRGGQEFRLGLRVGRWAGLTAYGIALAGLAVFAATYDPD